MVSALKITCQALRLSQLITSRKTGQDCAVGTNFAALLCLIAGCVHTWKLMPLDVFAPPILVLVKMLSNSMWNGRAFSGVPICRSVLARRSQRRYVSPIISDSQTWAGTWLEILKESSSEKLRHVLHQPILQKFLNYGEYQYASFRSNIQLKLDYSFYMLAYSQYLYTGESVF
ncbi:MAG TPA: hypothetical protein VI935_07220 [Thermodesulfobacteriota bacterium]|nr:hypothetical protein [Thermodesulfobacteriota bacterium]